MTFGKLSDMIQNAESMEIDPALRFAIDKPRNKALVITLNTRRQLYAQGVDALGVQLSDIGGTYTAYTLRLKDGTRPRNTADHIDLFDTGEFYESFEVITGPDAFHNCG